MDPWGKIGEEPMALHTFCESGSLTEVRSILMDQSGCVDDRDYRGRTPLHAAVEFAQIKVVQLLLNLGATVDATCDDGKTALHMACSLGNDAVVLMLLEKGAKHDAVSKNGYTALHYAATSAAPGEVIIPRLIELGVGVNTRDNIGQTPLIVAANTRGELNDDGARQQIKRKMELLLDAGADINAHTKNGDTAIHKTCKRHNYLGANLLMSKGADPCSKNNNGETAFSWYFRGLVVRFCVTFSRKGE